MPTIKIEVGKDCKTCNHLGNRDDKADGFNFLNLPFCKLFKKGLKVHIGWDTEEEEKKLDEKFRLDEKDFDILKCGECRNADN